MIYHHDPSSHKNICCLYTEDQKANQDYKID